jgi:hypothetical protein
MVNEGDLKFPDSIEESSRPGGVKQSESEQSKKRSKINIVPPIPNIKPNIVPPRPNIRPNIIPPKPNIKPPIDVKPVPIDDVNTEYGILTKENPDPVREPEKYKRLIDIRLRMRAERLKQYGPDPIRGR